MFNYVCEQMESREQIHTVKAENTTIESFQFHARLNRIFNLPLSLRYSFQVQSIAPLSKLNLLLRIASSRRTSILISGNRITCPVSRTALFLKEQRMGAMSWNDNEFLDGAV